MEIPEDVFALMMFIVHSGRARLSDRMFRGEATGRAVALGLICRWVFREGSAAPAMRGSVTLTPYGAEMIGWRLAERTIHLGWATVDHPFWIERGKPDPPCVVWPQRGQVRVTIEWLHAMAAPAAESDTRPNDPPNAAPLNRRQRRALEAMARQSA